jgi:hypothetical protein
VTRRSKVKRLRREALAAGGTFVEVSASALRARGLLPPLPPGTISIDLDSLDLDDFDDDTEIEPFLDDHELFGACLKTAGPTAGTPRYVRRTESESESDQGEGGGS